MSGLSIKAYYSAAELVELKLKSLPTAHKNIIDKAKREGWKTQKRFGRGGGYEYGVKSMPEDVQAEIVVKLGKSAVKNLPVLAEESAPVDAQLLWASYEQGTAKQQQKAQMKLGIMFAVAELVNGGMKILDALALVYHKHNQDDLQPGEKPVTVSALKSWWYQVKDADRSLWLPLLMDSYGAHSESRAAAFTPEAWAFFRADYFRNERPQFGSCYERLKRAASANGWVIPSPSSIKRKILREIPKTHQTYLRDGTYALSRMYPSLIRTVAGIEAMEWVNGDG
ncbi:transposase [Aggregatibacter actinomycetemcomitans serotype b str. SCC4092]|uniref:DNA-binding domain-containing protein n=1 Tax=Aggregatibacter actinomycetemcomitans TaxID=714 RepID=UPI00022AC110|nr:DNA-binding domain-containing protein [Aggregatibacter actinomycetemcomitans]KND83862.1 transposase [Aggregatibacter actinomycetemcomitans serotype b str. SCC1398]KOE51650.1 transposase [Aggregatibacter actinomycetemcomitans serotype b str. SCC4092]